LKPAFAPGETYGSHVPRTLTLNERQHGAVLEMHMRTYKCLTLTAAIAITALELLLFTRASELAPQVYTRRVAMSTLGDTAIPSSIDSTGDGGSVSGE